jgi:predicted outer membrane repeat protein
LPATFVVSSLKPVTLAYNVFTGNSAPSVGGAIFMDNRARVVLDHELIYQNSTQTIGGGVIYVDGDGSGVGSYVTILNCTIADNSNAGQNQGNGLYVQEYSRVTIKNSIFWGNTQDI